jgi:hypothetical protein
VRVITMNPDDLCELVSRLFIKLQTHAIKITLE